MVEFNYSMPGKWEKEETMVCKNCGLQLEDGLKTCPACGENLEKIRKPKAPKKPWSKKKKTTLICTLTASVLVLALLITATAVLWQPFIAPRLRGNDVYCRDNYQFSEFWANAAHDDVVATMGDYKLTNGVLQVYYWMQAYDLLEYYTEMYGQYATYYMGLDLSKPLSEQNCNEKNGMTWEQYFLEDAFYAWHRYQALYDESKKQGYQLPGEYRKYFAEIKTNMEKAAKEEGYDSVDAMLRKDLGGTVTFDDYYTYMETYYVGQLYFTDVTARLVFTEAELEKYYQENLEELKKSGISKESGKLVDLRNILVKPVATKDEHGNTIYTEEAWQECLEKAQTIMDTWLTGAKTETSFSALAEKKSEDDRTSENGGLTEYLGKNSWVTVDVRHILVIPEGGTKSEDGTKVTYSDEEWEACRKEAQALLDQYLAGEKTAEAFGALANAHSDDNNGKVTNGGLYEDVYLGQMVKPFEEWIFDGSRQVGETGLVKTEYGYHVMYFVHRDGAVDEWAFAEERVGGDHTLVKTDEGYQILFYISDEPGWEVYCRKGLMSKTTQELLESYMEARPITKDYRAIKLSQRTEALKES